MKDLNFKVALICFGLFGTSLVLSLIFQSPAMIIFVISSLLACIACLLFELFAEIVKNIK